VLLVAAVAAGCGSGGHGATAPRRSTLPLYFGMQGQRGIGAADAADLARQARIVNGTTRQLEAVGADIARADPGVRMFVYVNAMLSKPTDRFPPAWHLHDAAGQPVRSRVQGNYLMDPSSTAAYRGVAGWADHVRRACAAALRAVRVATGCFLDMVGPAPLRSGYNRDGAVPVDPATGRPFQPSAYLALTGRLARGVQRFTGRPVIANGIESGAHYYGGTSVLGRYVSGLEVEHWMGVGDWQARNPAHWRQNVQMLIAEGRAGHLLLVDLHPPAGGNAEQWREFALASFLIGYTGSEYFQFSYGAGHPTWRDAPAVYGLRLGVPSERRARVGAYAHGGVYWRRYTRGLVVANPSDRAVDVRLPGRYTVAGKVRTNMTLPPLSGALLAAAA
jgi:Hypothetical glycosyl hydrolase family 15